LGADHQATSATDATEASAGWYWQFNQKQGYKHDGTTRTPNTMWGVLVGTADWLPANDPCTILLGTGWRIPTKTEWENADIGWANYTNTYNSILKLHAAGRLGGIDGSLFDRGTIGNYWSSNAYNNTNGWCLTFSNSFSNISYHSITAGFSLRCLKD